jgi:thiopeptide-type bacteriocin biosynthesis protein
MSSLLPYGFFLLRSPLLTLKEGMGFINSKSLQAICSPPMENEDPRLETIRTSLRCSSPEFFERAQKKFDKKTESTLVRYILRMSARATPYGLLAGYSIGKTGSGKCVKFKPIEDWVIRFKKSGSEVLQDLFAESIRNDSFSSPHPTLSLEKDTLKVMRRYLNEDFTTKEIKELKLKLNPVAKRQLTPLLNKNKIKVTKDKFLLELKRNKILVPQISYQEYLPGNWQNIKFHAIKNHLGSLKNANIILNKTTEICELDQQTFAQVGKAAELLHRINSRKIFVEQKNQYIGRFCKTMETKFPSMELSLIEALDPNQGVLDSGSTANYGNEPLNTDFSELIEFLKDKILTSSKRMEEWNLSAMDIEKIEAFDKNGTYRSAKLPSSVSAMVEIQPDGNIHLKSLMGLPGHQYFSRFAGADDELWQHTQYIQNWNQKQNENVIFAEIIDWPETTNVATFNSRKILTNYIIPLEHLHQNWPLEKQILLKDLVVSVQYGRVRIRCKRLNVEIIPLLSTAYIYPLDKNPFFKFLAAVATQDNFNHLGWKWGNLRSLPYLPRVKYGNVILSTRQWRLSKEIITELTTAKDKLKTFREVSEDLNLPETFFAVFSTDQRLFINSGNNLMLATFLEALGANNSLAFDYIEEILGTENYEYLIPFKNTQRQPQDSFQKLELDSKKVSPILHIGDECAYFKMYTNTVFMDELLATDVQKFVRKVSKKYQIKYWFFIKYADPSPHLRIRIFLRSKDDWSELIKDINQFERSLFASKKIWNFQIETYRRDVEKDGNEKDNWRSFNLVSCLDSERVLELHQKSNFKQWSGEAKTLYAIQLAHGYLQLNYSNLEERILATKDLRMAYHTMGFPTSAKDRERFIKLWREQKLHIVSICEGNVTDATAKHLDAYFKKITTIYKNSSRINSQKLLHLALNRTFTGIKYSEEDQIYGLLYKAYLGQTYQA